MSKIYYKGKKPAEQGTDKADPAQKERTPSPIADSGDTAVPEKKADSSPKKNKQPEVSYKDAEKGIDEPKTKPTNSPERQAIQPEPQSEVNDEIAATSHLPEGEDYDPPKVEGFNKDRIIRYFKRHPKTKVAAKVKRFYPPISRGLTTNQVETRFTQFLFNDTNKKYSKSYASIFMGNIFTFFNLLCLIAFIMLLLAGTKGITNYLVIFITTANIIIGVYQEIRSKRAIDKLSILASSSVKAVRDGEICEIPTSEIVLDDVIILELGNQVPADCILAEGSVEVNESLLTGESVAIKKHAGDTLFAGSFIASGSGKCRVDKVGKETYLEKLTAKAKKYRRPNSELMNSIKHIIKAVSILIIPIAIGIFFVSKNNIPATNTVTDYIFSAEVNYALQRMCTVVIGMIPSGMLLLTSTALAVGVFRLAKNNTLV